MAAQPETPAEETKAPIPTRLSILHGMQQDVTMTTTDQIHNNMNQSRVSSVLCTQNVSSRLMLVVKPPLQTSSFSSPSDATRSAEDSKTSLRHKDTKTHGNH